MYRGLIDSKIPLVDDAITDSSAADVSTGEGAVRTRRDQRVAALWEAYVGGDFL